MTQDTVNEAAMVRAAARVAIDNAERDLAVAREELRAARGKISDLIEANGNPSETKEKLEDALDRIVELREFIEKMAKEVPLLRIEFKDDFYRLND
jgi:outer membrane protein TolC